MLGPAPVRAVPLGWVEWLASAPAELASGTAHWGGGGRQGGGGTGWGEGRSRHV